MVKEMAMKVSLQTCLVDWLNYGRYDLRTTSYATVHKVYTYCCKIYVVKSKST